MTMKKTTATTGKLESRINSLEARIAALEKSLEKNIRKKREYTDEQRAAIRIRLLAGQEAARKRREDKKPEKTSNKANKVSSAKPS